MKELLQTLILFLVICVSCALFISFFINMWWTLQLATVKRQVISELKPFHPSIEADLSFLKNQNVLIPSQLKSLLGAHELSTHLSEKTKKDLSLCVQKVTWAAKLFLLSFAAGAGVIILAVVFQIVFGM